MLITAHKCTIMEPHYPPPLISAEVVVVQRMLLTA